MIQTETIEYVICDICGCKSEKKGMIRRYIFEERQWDGHRNNYVEKEIDLCPECGSKIYPFFKNWIQEVKRTNESVCR